MALMKSKVIPEDAIILQEGEASNYAWEVIADWKPSKDVWALNYGPILLGAVNSLSGFMANQFYRKKLKVGSFGFFSAAVPVTAIPGLTTAMYHRHLITTDILLMKKEACPVCYEVKSGVLQLALGTLYPMILAPTMALMISNRYGTFRIPDLQEGPKVMYKFLTKLSKPFLGTLSYLIALQLVASSVLTIFEIQNNLTVRSKMLKLEQNIMKEQFNSS